MYWKSILFITLLFLPFCFAIETNMNITVSNDTIHFVGPFGEKLINRSVDGIYYWNYTLPEVNNTENITFKYNRTDWGQELGNQLDEQFQEEQAWWKLTFLESCYNETLHLRSNLTESERLLGDCKINLQLAQMNETVWNNTISTCLTQKQNQQNELYIISGVLVFIMLIMFILLMKVYGLDLKSIIRRLR